MKSWFALLGFIFSFTLGHSALASSVLTIRIQGVINTGTEKYFERAVRLAEKNQNTLLLVYLDTPGGLLNNTKKMVQQINQSKVPVAFYVSPSGASATSAGTILTLAAHVAAMAPGTNIGAAHPVGGQGEDISKSGGAKMDEKATNDTVSFIRAQAQLRGRNQEWAEQAIRQSVSITAEEAAKLKVVDLVAPDASAIFKHLKIENAVVTDLPKTTAEKLLTFLGDPNVSYLLMVLGGLGIYIEITTPGVSIPGILGSICLILSFVSFSTLPVNAGAVALLVLGFLLLILELFVSSYGALTIGGIVSIALGAIFLLDRSTGDLRISLALLIPTILALGVITSAIGWMIFRSRNHTYQGLDNLVGLEGTVQVFDTHTQRGKLILRGELWDFQGEQPFKIGDRVVIKERNGLQLKV